MATSNIDEHKLTLKGSESRDEFKHWHKNAGKRWFYATDLDFIFVEKNPPGIAAALDYKKTGDPVSFAEAIAYNWFLERGCPVYIVTAESPFDTAQFKVERYLRSNWKPNPPDIQLELIGEGWTAARFWQWEQDIRNHYRSQGKIITVAPAQKLPEKLTDEQIMNAILSRGFSEGWKLAGRIMTALLSLGVKESERAA